MKQIVLAALLTPMALHPYGQGCSGPPAAGSTEMRLVCPPGQTVYVCNVVVTPLAMCACDPYSFHVNECGNAGQVHQPGTQSLLEIAIQYKYVVVPVERVDVTCGHGALGDQ